MPMSAPFWQTQCPARSIGLTHTRSLNDAEKCNDCGARLMTDTMPPIDVQARMEAMGLVEHADGTLVEPRYTTGRGPEGREDGRGRGPLTALDKVRLTFYTKFVRHGDDTD